MTTTLSNPPFVAIEGLDGAGTTTQTRRVAEALTSRGQPVAKSCEPTEGPVGMLIRQMLTKRISVVDADGQHQPVDRETLALLFAADRLDHLNATVDPALQAGKVALTDRYYHSSLAYQGDIGGDDDAVDYRWVEAINERARAPDLTVFLEASAELCLKRLSARGRRDIYESREKLERLERRYDEVIERVEARGEPILRLDAADDPGALTERIVDELYAVAQ